MSFIVSCDQLGETFRAAPFCALNLYSRGQYLCKFIGTKERIYIRKGFDSHRIFQVHHHGRRFIVLEHQYGSRDVM